MKHKERLEKIEYFLGLINLDFQSKERLRENIFLILRDQEEVLCRLAVRIARIEECMEEKRIPIEDAFAVLSIPKE